MGVKITEDGRSTQEVKERIAMAKQAYIAKRKLFDNKALTYALRKRLVKTYVWSIALYGAETWTVGRDEMRRMEALEMWCWRRMEKVSWTQRVTNEQILERVGERRQMMGLVRNRRHRWMGHVLRHGGLLREVMEGRVEGKRPRGRPRMNWVEQLVRGAECGSY